MLTLAMLAAVGGCSVGGGIGNLAGKELVTGAGWTAGTWVANWILARIPV
ncbi:MAG: hypothetical protein WC975_09835 [Phycisphaerae bacterium]